MIRFGNRIEPMTDLHLIKETDAVRFAGEKSQDTGMVLSLDRPWEKEGSLGLTVFEDQGTVKMYYRGFPIPSRCRVWPAKQLSITLNAAHLYVMQ